MGAKGDKKTGGRVKGTVNKTSRLIAEMCEETGKLKPAEYLIKVMHDPKTEQNVKIECAKHLLPYTDRKMPVALETDNTHSFPQGMEITFTKSNKK